MSRSRLVTFTSLGSLIALVAASSCGHTKKTLDAFKRQQGDPNGSDSDDAGDGDGDGGGYVEGTPAWCSTADPNLPKFSCEQVATQQYDEVSMREYCVPEEVQAEVDLVLSLMGPGEKALQMTGIPVGNKNWRDIERSPDVPVSGYDTIRGFRYRDAGRGVNLDAGQDNRVDDMRNYATAFPAPSLRAASWDVELERRIGAAIGDETAASHNNMNLGPCMNIVRHPYWGRTQETYGEDMYTIGRFAAAYSVGVQEYVVGCAKHWAGNNIEKSRSKQDAVMTEQTLREVYGRHFEMVVQDGGIGCIMASYNMVNKVKATQSEHLLRTILKGPTEQGGFGFQGLVITDWWAMPGDQDDKKEASLVQAITNEAVIAGTDIEVPWQLHYSEQTLALADQTYVTDAARRILTQKFLFNSARQNDPWSRKPPTSRLDAGGGSIAPNEAHEALAEEAVVKSAVLLDNGRGGPAVLPVLDAAHIAVIGMVQPFKQISSSVPPTCGYSPDIVQFEKGSQECDFNHGTDVALGDRGSSRVNGDPARSVGPFAGIRAAGEARGAVVVSGVDAQAAVNADTVVVVVGYTPGDEGEEYYIQAGGDRSSLDLPPGQNELVKDILDLNKKTIIIVQSGSIVNLPWLTHANKNQATFWAGYPGMRSGPAYARLIFGEDNFAGKFPMAWPKQDQLFPFKDSETATTMGYFFGYRLWDKMKYIDQQPVDLEFPFGHGLSYSTFEYSDLVVPCAGTPIGKEAIFEVTVNLSNTAGPDGDGVAFLFVKPPPTTPFTGERPWKELKSFARVSVPAGGTATASLPVRVRDLRRWEGGTDGRWVVDSGEYTILVGKDSEHAETAGLTGTFVVSGD